MLESEAQSQFVRYLQFNELQNPEFQANSSTIIEEGLASKQWIKNFDAITQLRQANRFYAHIFLQQLLPVHYQQIIQQIDNLRSSNSKEALTLASEIIEHQNIQKVDSSILRPLIAALFIKTTSDKGFLKNQALKAVTFLPQKYNASLIEEIGCHIQSNNGNISELAAKILTQYIQKNKITDLDANLTSTMAEMVSGKRALVQKKGRQILLFLKKQKGEEYIIQNATEARKKDIITQQCLNGIIRELKKEEKTGKSTNFKDFLKAKKD